MENKGHHLGTITWWY